MPPPVHLFVWGTTHSRKHSKKPVLVTPVITYVYVWVNVCIYTFDNFMKCKAMNIYIYSTKPGLILYTANAVSQLVLIAGYITACQRQCAQRSCARVITGVDNVCRDAQADAGTEHAKHSQRLLRVIGALHVAPTHNLCVFPTVHLILSFKQ